ncbi:MAG: response regulator transcription factor [Motiliproteus sp.]|nr:response regulator transcription factor [Motiliproteus sp.]MCW9054312.1 response regulator transcription factor [Motiliproteus sp.]
MLHIAILEPQRQLAESLMDWLQQAGHRYTCCSNLDEFIACINFGGYDLLLVDFGGQTNSGLDRLGTAIIDDDRRIPLLFISEPDCERDIVLALEHGADDYMVKPLNPEELVSRIQVLIRRFLVAQDEPKVQCYGPYCIDHEQLVITRHGEELSLTGKDFSLAAFMFAHQNQLLSRHRLLSEVWGVNQEVNTRTVDMHISRLRKALALTGTPFQIQTVHQHGYRFLCSETSSE